MAALQRCVARAVAAAPRVAAPARGMATVNAVGPMVRASSSGLRATVFGAYGFVGKYVTALLGA